MNISTRARFLSSFNPIHSKISERVGRAAQRAGIALAELRSASDGASLEQLFFELTTDKPDHESGSNRQLEEAVR